MKRLTRSVQCAAVAGVLAVGLGTATLALPNSASAANKDLDLDLDVKQHTLDNGLRLYVVEDHSTPAFNISIYYDVGAIDEKEGRTGFAHFFEHMMFMGSEKMPKFAIGEYTEEAGGNFNAGTTWDYTVYYHNIPSNYLDLVLWGESDRLSALDISEKTFEDQRAAVKSEKDRSDNQPYAPTILYDFFPVLFEGTKYDVPPIGTLDDLNAAEVKDVKEFFDAYYTPANATMVIVGDVDFEEVKKKVEDSFGPIAKSGKRPERPPMNQVHGRKVEKSVVDDKAQQTIYFYGWPTVGLDHPDRAALDLLGTILMGGDSARLSKKLTDEKEYTVGAGGGHNAFRYAGMMFMQAVPTDGTKGEDISGVVLEELNTLAKRGVSKKELEKAVNQQIMGTVSSLATNQGKADAIGQGVLFFDDPKWLLSDLERYQKVTTKDIKRVAKEYLTENWVMYEIKGAE